MQTRSRFGARHRWPPFGSPRHPHRKDVPHLSESLSLELKEAICRECRLTNFKITVIARSRQAFATARCTILRPRSNALDRSVLRRAHAATMSLTSRDSGCAATRRSAASARARRPLSSARQLLNADSSRAATCGFFAVEREHRVGDEVVAGAVGAVELLLVRHARRRRSARARGWDWRTRTRSARSARLRGRASPAPGSWPAARTTCRSISGSAW